MKSITCEMCGSNDLIKDDGVFVCQNCGCKYSVDEVKKMMVEGTVEVKGTVKVDSSNKLENLYELARRANEENNDESAQSYYEQILLLDPGSWEASFYSVYFKAKQCRIMDIASAANSVSNCLANTFSLIKKNVKDINEQKKAIYEVIIRVEDIAIPLCVSAENHYNGLDSSIKDDYTNEYVHRVKSTINLMYNCGDAIYNTFSDPKLQCYAAGAWKKGVVFHKNTHITDKSAVDVYSNKILMYSIAHPDVMTKNELIETRTMLADSITAKNNLIKFWNKKWLNILIDSTIGPILSAIITGIIYVIVGAGIEDFTFYPAYIYTFIVIAVLIDISVLKRYMGGDKALKELHEDVDKKNALLEKLDEIINSK